MTSSTRRRLALLASLGAVAAALFPREAAAQEIWGGAGMYTSFTFGDDYFGVGWGLEAMMSVVLVGGDECSNAGQAGLGPTIQVGAINADTFRFVGALHGGGNVGDSEDLPVLDGELGLALHADEDDLAAGVHTGIAVDVPVAPIITWTNFVRAEWLLNEYSVGGGVFFPGRYGVTGTSCSDGRPLRDDLEVLPLGEASGVDASRLDSAARGWVEDAQAEAASVPAFLCLAAELLHARAPLALVDRALDAAADEIRHARACAEIASRLTGARVVPTAPPPPRRAALRGDALLTRLAAESWLDGCLNEGAAAARAARAATFARKPGASAVRGRIAVDETRHAELGWDVLAFALSRGGSEVHDTVRGLRHEQVSFTRESAAGDERWGQLDRTHAEEANAHATDAAQRRLDALL
jgi:hypothetical protein